MSFTKDTQLTSAIGYDTKNMIFSEPISKSISSNGGPSINFKRIPISTLNPDGSVGDLILSTGRLFSYGLTETKDMATGVCNGYQLPLCMYDRDGPTEDQLSWVKTFDNIVERCKKHILEYKEELDKDDLVMSDLRALGANVMWWPKVKDDNNKPKRDAKGKVMIDESKGPTLYPKLITSYSKGKGEESKSMRISTQFYDKNDNPIEPLTLMQVKCYMEAAVKIESIFVGSKISIQVKVYEASNIEIMDNTMKRLLPRPKPAGRLTLATSNPMTSSTSLTTQGSDDEGSINGDDEVAHDSPPTPKKKKTRVVKKMKRAKKTEESDE